MINIKNEVMEFLVKNQLSILQLAVVYDLAPIRLNPYRCWV